MTALRLAALSAALSLVMFSAAAQSPPPGPPSSILAPEPRPRDPGTLAKDRAAAQQRKGDAPAADSSRPEPPQAPECAWIGQRIVHLLARDDAVAANDFMPFYLRFGCPEERVGKAFGCIVRSGDGALQEMMAERVAKCWADPSIELPKASPAEAQPPAPAQPPATPTAPAQPPAQPQPPQAQPPQTQPPQAQPPQAQPPAAGSKPEAK
jgi:hypothetical protein